MSISKHRKRMHVIWIVITVIGVLAMLAFTLAPAFMYR